MQHGYCHSINENLPELKFNYENRSLTETNIDLKVYSEFYGQPDIGIIRDILNGKDILEKTFNAKMTTFVSPQEYFSRGIWCGLKKANYDYCGVLVCIRCLVFP